MCGIAGFIDFNKKSQIQILKKMTDTMVNRGPDDSGYKLLNSDNFCVGLGHRRLSILDLSKSGHQPMYYDNYHLVYNGEIYNFKEIRSILEKDGYYFKSNTDSEVILKAFHKWGVNCVDKFRGMFAFTIVDLNKNKVFIFRDRAGVKPLYYYYKDSLFLFASELKAIQKHPDFKKEIDKDALQLYLQFGYIPAPYSIFCNTFKLFPGHYIEVNLEKNSYEEKKYWDVFNFYKKDKLELNEDEIEKKLKDILKESFNLRMVSDVPVGVFLSGGIDSSLIASIIQESSEQSIKTFTIGFNEKDYNEAEHAKEIAKHLGTEHKEYYCKPEDIKDLLIHIPEIYDEPFADDSAIPTIIISKFAKKDVSVILSGDGGDEIFCGYSKYHAVDKLVRFNNNKFKAILFKFLVLTLNENLVYFINKLLPKSKQQTNIKEKFLKFKRVLLSSKSIDKMFVEASSPVSSKRVEKILKRNNQGIISNSLFKIFNKISKLTKLEQMMLIDYKTYLPDEVLVKVDRATMYSSLEGREPFLDHKIIEFVALLPVSEKYKNSTGKYLSKKILSQYLPSNLLEKPKTGFQLPLSDWLRKDFKYIIDSYFTKENLEKDDLFNVKEIQLNIKAFYNGDNTHVNEIWHILIFLIWREKWL